MIAFPEVMVWFSGFTRAAEQPSPQLTLIGKGDILDGKP
jgi:hypothetical protein